MVKLKKHFLVDAYMQTTKNTSGAVRRFTLLIRKSRNLAVSFSSLWHKLQKETL